MAEEDECDENKLLLQFQQMSEDARVSFLKKCFKMCKKPQLKKLFKELDQILATDFVVILPNELSEKIFSCLDAKSLCQASSVNKSWRRILNNNKLWYQLCLYKDWTSYCYEKNLLQAPLAISTRKTSMTAKSSSPRLLPSHEFKDTVSASNCFEQADLCKWKDIYARVTQLERNWREGIYIVKYVFRGHSQPVTCMDCNGERIASGSMDATVRVWDVDGGKCLKTLSDFTDAVKCLRLKNDILVTGCCDTVIRAYEMETFILIRTLVGHTGSVDHICFEGDVIVSASSHDRTLRVWSVVDGACLSCLTGHSDDIETIQLRVNTLVSTSWDESVKVWDIREGILIHSLRGHTEVILCCQFDDVMIVTGGADGLIIIWDTIYGYLKQTLYGHTAEVYCLQFNENFIASGSADSTAKIWSIQGQLLHSLEGHIGIVRCLSLRDKILVTGGDCKKVMIWDIESGNLLNVVHHHPTSLYLMWTDRTKIITASPETPGTVTLLSFWS